MVKWVCQIVTPVRHRALIFDVRLFTGNTADDALVTGNTRSFCRLMCLCVKRRNIMLNDKRHLLLNSALFRTSFLPGGSLPAFRSPWCAGCGTSPEDISRSDGHAIFKVQVRLQDHFSEKYSPLPYIQEVGKRAEKRRFPRLWTRPERAEI